MKTWKTKRLVATALLLAVSLLISGASLAAGPVVQAWIQSYLGPANPNIAHAIGHAIAVDQTNGNVYVTGYALKTNGSPAYATIAYSSHGTPLWTNLYVGPGDDASALAMAVDSSNGNVYVTGQSVGTISWEFATVAYSGSGAALWTNCYHNPSFLYAVALTVAVGASGNVYVAGAISSDDDWRYVTVAYTSGGSPLWTNFYENAPFESAVPAAVAVDAQENVYVTGTSDNGLAGSAFATVAYSSTGAALWTNYNSLPAPPPYGGYATATAMAVDSVNRRVYVTGYAVGGDTDYDYATIAYASDGTPVWTNRYAAPGNSIDCAKAVGLDKSGNVYVTGTAGTGSVTLAYSSTGTPLWTNQCDGTGQAVAVDANGNVIVAGTTGSYPHDFLTVAYSSTGSLLWTNRYDGPVGGDDLLPGNSCLATGHAAGVYVNGASQIAHDGFTNYNYITIKYMPAPDIRLTGPDPLPGAAWLLTLEAQTNTDYRLEASSNLVDWSTLTNYTNLPTPSILYTDTLAAGCLTRFYRAMWVP
jgi:outer membrane protein assembly factor BamB